MQSRPSPTARAAGFGSARTEDRQDAKGDAEKTTPAAVLVPNWRRRDDKPSSSAGSGRGADGDHASQRDLVFRSVSAGDRREEERRGNCRNGPPAECRQAKRVLRADQESGTSS